MNLKAILVPSLIKLARNQANLIYINKQISNAESETRIVSTVLKTLNKKGLSLIVSRTLRNSKRQTANFTNFTSFNWIFFSDQK